MNDKIIINVISKTYFAIISFFVFIFLIFSTSFIALQNGIFIDKMHIQNIELEELYIKWNKKLDISLKEVKISQNKKQKSSSIHFNDLSKYLKILSKTTDWFDSVIIEKITSATTKASFKYKSGENGFIVAKSDTIDINASIFFENETLVLKILKAYDNKRDISTQGYFYFNTKDIAIYTNLHTKISTEADVNLYTKIDTKKLTYKLQNNHNIKDIKHIIDILKLPKHLRYWVYEAISMRNLVVDKVSGFVEYDKIRDAYKNLKIDATINKLAYKYNKNLEAVSSSSTQLQFKKGVLYIYPHDAYSYGMYLDKSWLKIDFNTKEELLSLNLLFDASVNRDILKILNTYKIKLPFIQHKGKINTDLSLKLWLQSLDVDVHGNFFTKKANIDYLGLNLDVFDTSVNIDNNDIYIKKMKASYKNIAKANVYAHYNAKQNKGQIDFNVKSVHAGKFNLYQAVDVTYIIKPKGDDIINVASSKWKFHSKTVNLDSNQLSFNMKNLQLKIPSTTVQLKNIGNATISGIVDLNTTTAQLDANIVHFSYDGIEISQLKKPIKIKYDKHFSLQSEDAINFSIVGTKYKADKIYVDIEDDNIYLKHTLLNIGKYISTKIYINYNTKLEKAHISLNNFLLIDPNSKNVLYKKKKILLSAQMQADTIKINSKELEAGFSSKESGWKLYLNSIDKIARDSLLLQKYHLKDGEFNLYRNKKDKFTRFKSKISYPYKILVKANKPLSNYTLKGKIYKEKVFILINDIVNVNIKENIDIRADNSAIDIQEVLRAIGDINGTRRSTKSLNISAKFTNSYLYVDKKRRIIYDTINLKYFKKTLTANLNYNNAHSHLRVKNKKIHLYGSNFNDVFMNKLFSLTNLHKGSLDFSVTGDIDNYNGVLYVRKSLLKDYKILNNILAFINTVPSLITFSLPGYNKEGLFIDKSYVKFNYQKKKMNISDIYLDSKEIDILGKGSADLKKDYLDLVLNLKTDLGSDLAKVPLVGYILLDGNSLSTTISVKGKISNPKIESLLAKEIIVAPFNIIKRTLLLPYKLFKDIK